MEKLGEESVSIERILGRRKRKQELSIERADEAEVNICCLFKF